MNVADMATRWAKGAAYGVTSLAMTLLTEETVQARCARAWFVISVLSVGAVLLAGENVCWRDVHMTFWLGTLPQVALLVAMLALASAFLFAVRIRLVTHFRSVGRDTSGIRGRLGRHGMCEFSLCNVVVTVLMLGLLGLAAIAVGRLTITRGASVMDSLVSDCLRKDSASAAINSVHGELRAFHAECLKTTQRRTPVHRCPGFKRTFHDPSPYVDYLALMEFSWHCSGFCTKSRALFVYQANVTRARAPQPCAHFVAHQVRRGSLLVGVPAVAIGAIVLIGALLLSCYDHL